MKAKAEVVFLCRADVQAMLEPYETVFRMTTDEMLDLRSRGLLDTPEHARWAMYAAMRDQGDTHARRHELPKTT